jgi:hypothetical protein
MQLADEDPIPPYVSVHIRHADFRNYCPTNMTAKEMLTDCFAPISAIKAKVDEVRAEIHQRYNLQVRASYIS